MVVPPELDDFLAAEASYENTAPTALPGGFVLVFRTSTLVAYIKRRLVASGRDTLLLGVRGTIPSNLVDLKADASIAVNRLRYSSRMQTDVQSVKQLARMYSPQETDWYLSGHSLGSAVGLELARQFPWIKGEVYYNGALQPQDLWSQDPRALEVYTSKDPLFRIAGRWWRRKRVIAPLDLSNKEDWMSQVRDAIGAHGLSQFGPMYGFKR
jgi:pimeloyl-ACP methyl ester carboxylesterase